MIRILFVCHGNICRSPMAQCVMQHLVDTSGRTKYFTIDSAATSREELGNAIYPSAQRILRAHGVPVLPHRARQITVEDFRQFNFIIGMDSANMRNLRRMCPESSAHKVRALLNHDVADPWYTGDFDITYRDVLVGCEQLLQELTHA